MTVAETSRSARAAVEKHGGVTAGCRRVMVWIHGQPADASHTRAEIARGTGMPLQTVCARVRDILDEPRPLLEELAPRACTITGNPSKPLRIARPHAAAPAETPSPQSDTQAMERAAAAPKAAAQVPGTVRPGDVAGVGSLRVEPATSAVVYPASAAPGSALELVREKAARALANRARMPLVSAFVDELRREFPEARVRYAAEAGQTVGKPGDPGVQATASWSAKQKQPRAA